MNPRSRDLDLMRTWGILTLLCLTVCLHLPSPAKSSMIQSLGILPGDSSYPQLVALDSQNTQLFFRHFYQQSPDTIGITSLRRVMVAGTWTEVTFAAPSLGGNSQGVHPSFSQSTNFSMVYFHSATTSIRIQRFVAGTWSSGVTLFTKEDLQHPGPSPSHITNLQAVMDSVNHLHLMWERYIDIDEFENGTLVAKRALFYSEYDGERASPPEQVMVFEYGTHAIDSPYYDPCAPGIEPCFRSFLTIDPVDRLHLAWFTGSTFFTTRTSEGWMEPYRVDTTPYSENITIPTEIPYIVQADLPLLDFQIDSAGVVYFFYSVAPENDRLLLITYQDATFTQWESNLSTAFHPYYINDLPMKLFDVERDSRDLFHIVSIESDGTDSSSLSYHTFKGGFSDPVLVSELGGSELYLSIDMEDTPHIAWRRKVEHEELFYTHLTETGWQRPFQVTNGTEIARQFGWSSPKSSSTTSQPPLAENLLPREIFVGILTTSVLLAIFRRYWSKKRENS